MSASTTPACPLGLTADDLSAWRDHALASADERRITAHTSGCPACQRTIAAHAALAAALLAEQPPAPDPRNWSMLHARINGDRQPHAPAGRRHTPRRAIWGGLGAAAAVLLISALFLTLFQQQAQRRGATSQHKTIIAATPPALTAVPPTAPITGPALDWQTRMAPESVIPPPGNQTDNSNIAVAPTNAQTMYICFTQYASHPTPVEVWATHDGARTWTHVSDLPAISESPDCIINVDAHDPLRINVVDFGQDNNLSGEAILSSISDDGGKTWRTLNDKVSLEQLATRGNTSVAVTNPLAFLYNSQQTMQRSQLVISHDGFRSWSPIDGQLTAPDNFITGVWQRPGDGALLALVATQHALNQPTSGSTPTPIVEHYYTWALWTSADEGASWTRFPVPPNFTGFPGYIVAQPVGFSPWTVCGLSTSDGGVSLAVSAKELVGCTYDGGTSWVSLPLPDLKNTCGSNCLQQQTIVPNGSCLLSDGSLLIQPGNIFRLQRGATQWQDLGPEPGNALLTINSSPHGALVSYSGGGSLDGLGGTIVGHLGGDIPNRGALAFAMLP